MEQSRLVVRLTEAEENQAIEIARAKNKCSTEHGAQSKLVDKEKSDFERTVEGTRAELAIAKVLGLELNLTGIDNPSGDGGYDFRVGEDTIDVKYTNMIGGNLLFRSPESFKATISVFTEPEAPGQNGVAIVGWITRREFLSIATEYDAGNGRTAYLAPRASLKPFQRIIDLKKSYDRAARPAPEPVRPTKPARKLTRADLELISKMVTIANKISDEFAGRGFSGNIYALTAEKLPDDYARIKYFERKIEAEPTKELCASYLRLLQNLHGYFERAAHVS